MRRQQRGYLLLATGLGIFAVMGAAGLAIDLGRLYVAKNEAQTFVDAAAIAAALELDGTQAGFQRARDAVGASTNRWNFGSGTFSGTVGFSQNSAGPWEANPVTAADYRFARVGAGAAVPMTFMQVLGSGERVSVSAGAVAGQVLKTGFREGVFPFSPYAHNAADPNHYGLVPGTVYTLRWGANPKLTSAQSTCLGDAKQKMIDIATYGANSERGYIESSSASIIRQSIMYDYQTVYREIGDSVVLSGGIKQTQRDSLIERVRQDTDQQSWSFAEYFANGEGTGNGRRLVACPVNLGPNHNHRIAMIGAFFLLPEQHYQAAMGGNKPFCAEYVGAYKQGGSGPGASNKGYYVVRLVQ